MPNYNIYLKSEVQEEKEVVSNQEQKEKEKTKPRQFTFSEDKRKKTDPSHIISLVGSYIQNPDGLISTAISKGKSTLMASHPAVKVAMTAVEVAASIADRIITTYNSFATITSGDYKFATEYENFKRGFNILTHPVGTALSRGLQLRQQEVANLRHEQESMLLGGTILNSKYGRYL